ncbi:MAG: hypothetical protein HFH49_02070 [Lachnospiraceae bacterium]|nr:hypothetical protein [Lachnospiraceae bacterium]
MYRKAFRILKIKMLSKLHLCRKEYREGIRKRNVRFAAFEEWIPHSRPYGEKTIAEAAEEFDLFVCGSDQIWNPALKCLK